MPACHAPRPSVTSRGSPMPTISATRLRNPVLKCRAESLDHSKHYMRSKVLFKIKILVATRAWQKRSSNTAEGSNPDTCIQKMNHITSRHVTSHTYIHTYIHACMHACLLTYRVKYTCTHVHVCMHVHMCVYIYIYIVHT